MKSYDYSAALGDLADASVCNRNIYYDISGGPNLHTVITAYDVNYLNNNAIGGRKLDTSPAVADEHYKGYLMFIQGDICMVKTVWIFENMINGISAVKINTIPEFSISHNIALVGYEEDGMETLIQISVNLLGTWDLQSTKIVIPEGSQILPQGIGVGINALTVYESEPTQWYIIAAQDQVRVANNYLM